MTTSQERRVSDQRVTQLVSDVAVLKEQMSENTAVTCQVRDILASFKVMASIAKWITVITAMIASILAVIKGMDFRK